MRVLITGAVGFTGNHLVNRLRQEGSVEITGMGLEASAPAALGLAAYHSMALSDQARLAAVIRETKPQWLFHLAGQFRGALADLYKTNLVGTLNLLEAVKAEAPECAVLMVGSAAEYGVWSAAEMPLREDHECRPLGAYAVSKYAATLAGLDYARSGALRVLIARPFNLLGAGIPPSLVAGAIVARAQQALATQIEPSIVMGSLDAQRDFIAVEDAVDAYVNLLKSPASGEIFNICSGRTYSIQHVLETLLSFAPRPIEVTQDSALLRANEVSVIYGDNRKSLQMGCLPPRLSLHDSLKSAWDHAVAQAASAVPK